LARLGKLVALRPRSLRVLDCSFGPRLSGPRSIWPRFSSFLFPILTTGSFARGGNYGCLFFSTPPHHAWFFLAMAWRRHPRIWSAGGGRVLKAAGWGPSLRGEWTCPRRSGTDTPPAITSRLLQADRPESSSGGTFTPLPLFDMSVVLSQLRAFRYRPCTSESCLQARSGLHSVICLHPFSP